MTSKYSRRRISTGISVAGLLAMVVGMAEITITDGNANKTSNAVADTKTKEGVPEAKKLILTDLSHAELVDQLANENFLIREDASKLLWRRGKTTLSALKKAASSSNPELKSRATELIRYIKVGLSPDNPPHIAKLIQSFENADGDEKEDILKKLYAEKAYSEMLFMLSGMKDKELARDLYNEFNRLAHLAAKDSLGRGDTEAAIEQLKLAPRNETTLRSLAYIYSLTGRLDEETNKLKQMRDKEWEIHLRLENSNRSEIQKFALKENLTGVIANLELLGGNPSMMYKFYSKNAPSTAKTGLAILKAQYEGGNERFIETAHAKQHQIFANPEIDFRFSKLQNQTIRSMCLTGAGHRVESIVAERYSYQSFSYLQRREQPKEALATLGISGEESLQKFIEENTRLAINALNSMVSRAQGFIFIPYRTRLIYVAEFYYKRGLPQTAKKIIKPLLKELQAQGNIALYNTIVENVANQGMHDLAIEVILDRENDNNTYEQMIKCLYGKTVDTDLIWNALLKRDDATPEIAFRDLAVIMGVYQNEIETYLKLQKSLIIIATRKGVDDLKDMRSALLSTAIYRQDAISAKKYAKILLDTEKEKGAIPLRKLEYLRELSNNLDWQGIVDLLDDDSCFIKNSPKWNAVYSVAKRKLGDTKAADQLLSHSKLLSIGLNHDLYDIAIEHHHAGYYDISSDIVERILIVSSMKRNSDLYKFALNYLTRFNNSYMNNQQWGKAAAFFMVHSASYFVERSTDSESSNIVSYINDFYNSQFTRGMELYQKGEKTKGLKMLSSAHKAIVGDATLADHFYPTVKTTDLSKQYNLWVDESHQYLNKSIAEFPECANTHNSLAWVLSRAVRKIDVGIQHSEKANRLKPFEAAYIDTMAELYHAKGDRKKAVEWGKKAVLASKYGRLGAPGMISSSKILTHNLNNQLERFKTEPKPKP